MGNIVDQEQPESKNTEDLEEIPFYKVVLSVMQASFGVQNQKNKERDFKQGKLLPFIVAALIFTGLFVLTLVFVVRLVLGST